jgi:hypothetical protein
VAKEWRPESVRYPVIIVPVLCGLFVAPLLTMIYRSTLVGMIFSGTAMAGTWLVTIAIARRQRNTSSSVAGRSACWRCAH